jgi:hypothetical protein
MSDAPRPAVPDGLLGTLVSILDLAVLERQPGGAFRQIGGEPPSWFVEAMKNTDPGAAVTVVQAFPVLESFLAEADAFWRTTAYGRLEGEAFVITDSSGRNLPVAPIAVVMEGRHFLLLHRASGFDERQRVLQRAREQALDQEKMVKQIDGLRRPVVRLGNAVTGLTKGPLSDVQAVAVTTILKELEELQKQLEELPKLPPASSAGRR